MAPWRSSPAASMRHASITTSCVAEANATSTANADHQPEIGRRVGARDQPQAEDDDCLRHQHPTPAMAQERRQQRNCDTIDQRRPQELERVGERREAEEADRAQRHARLTQPGRKRVEDEQVGQTRGEPQGQHDQHAALEENGKRSRGRGFLHAVGCCAPGVAWLQRGRADPRQPPQPPGQRGRRLPMVRHGAQPGLRPPADQPRSLTEATFDQKNRSWTSMMSPGSTSVSGAASSSGPLEPPRLITMSSWSAR